ncbi:MAG: 3-deoxy-7-phosphoheptulonate synthase [Candidatus Natronoplasma sp.]
MMCKEVTDGNVDGYRKTMTPAELKQELPLSEKMKKNVVKGRREIKDILDKKSKKKMVITGPCSIHDIEEAKEYADRIKELSDRVGDKFLLVMRAYLEKPRTTLGWKGLINDPHLNGSYDINAGLRKARELLIYAAKIGVPTGTEFLGSVTPQYIDDLISWAAIGARTTESQPHREMVSGLSVPVGFKNDTKGNVELAVNGIKTAKHPHSFRGINRDGEICIVDTTGNDHCHVVLRGGNSGNGYVPNYDSVSIERTLGLLRDEGLPENIVVDCSHGNSGKDHEKQPRVFRHVVEQIGDGDDSIIGFMLESNLEPGNQSLSDDPSELERGVSITDACIGWNNTEDLILEAYKRLED